MQTKRNERIKKLLTSAVGPGMVLLMYLIVLAVGIAFIDIVITLIVSNTQH